MKIILKQNFTIKITFGVVVIAVVLWGLFTYFSYNESREHDRIPVILSSNVKMEIIANKLEYDEGYKDGSNCSEVEQKAVLQSIHELKDNQFYTCKRFDTEKGTFYWIEKASYALVVLEKTLGIFELVIKDTGGYGNYKNYPGIYSLAMRGNSKNVVFIYEGWNNPRKIIKLSIN